MTIPEKKSYRGLRQYIIIILCVAAAIPLAFIGGGVYFEYRKSMTDKIRSQLTSIVLHHKESIEKFLHETSSAMKVVVQLESLDRISQQSALQSIFNSLQQEYDQAFEDMGVIDGKGNHVVYVGPYDLQNRNYSTSIWFNEAMEKQIYISDVFLGFRQVPHFIIAVRKNEGPDAWILRATINADKFGNLVENVRLGQTGEAFIINREGMYQTRSRSGGSVMKTVDPKFLEISHFDDVRLWEVEWKGVRLIRAKTWMKDNNWMLIVQQEVDDAFSELFATRNRAIVVFILGAVLVGIATFFTTELLIKKIEKADKERDLLNEQLIQSQKLASIGEFSAGIAHEINNPLAVIYVETELVQTILKKEDVTRVKGITDIKDSLNEIKIQVNRCKEITHKLLNFARKMDSVLKEVDINALIDEIVGMRERDASFMNIVIVKKYQHDLPPVCSDPSLLRQVILNLINNAIDAMEKGGQIIIGTRMEPMKAASRKNGMQSDGLVIFVQDTGVGIPEENLQKIFDPFFTTKPPGKGTGLGLSICHGIIQKLGGNISAASQVGKGTTFTIKLPIEYQKGVI
ncbi:MAG: ATP-binding protein [Desulfatirhabdiaceae bacterium]